MDADWPILLYNFNNVLLSHLASGRESVLRILVTEVALLIGHKEKLFSCVLKMGVLREMEIKVGS